MGAELLTWVEDGALGVTGVRKAREREILAAALPLVRKALEDAKGFHIEVSIEDGPKGWRSMYIGGGAIDAVMRVLGEAARG